jgi:hypothetical protein
VSRPTSLSTFLERAVPDPGVWLTAFGAAVLALLPGDAPGQEVEYELGEEVLVASGPNGRVLIEPHLATHPSDPDQLVGVSWVYPTEDGGRGAQQCATFRSTDGGLQWERQDLTSMGCGDPWISVSSRGIAVLTALGTHPSLPDSANHLLAFFSRDAGGSWHDVPQRLGEGHDGPRSLAAPDGTIYVVSGQAWRPGPEGSRFSIFLGRARPGRVYVDILPRLLPSNLNLNSDGFATLSDGTLVITYYDYQRPVPEGGFRSRAGALEGRRLWAMVSEDEGHTFSIPFLMTEECWYRPTFLAADTSDGPFRDRLYNVCEGREQTSVLLAYSTDGGEVWSAPTPIEAPAREAGSRSEPQVTVNGRGVLGVVWMDGRDDPGGRCYAPYFAASSDGGLTFGPAVRVATELSCPDPALAGEAATGRWPRGGDYFGFAAGADGRFHLLWPDARDGAFELRTAAVSVRVGTAR